MRLPWFRATRAPIATGRYRRHDRVVAAQHGDRTVLMSLAGGEYFALDPVGSRVWALLDQPATADDIARVMAGEYDAPESVIRSDVQDLLDSMARDGLVLAA